ncbi:MAG: hypothetical protein MZW92_01710 [Comamonadaceae bacterium]|nr:hypothetical protein [Comamonadaceae bacterium]
MEQESTGRQVGILVEEGLEPLRVGRRDASSGLDLHREQPRRRFHHEVHLKARRGAPVQDLRPARTGRRARR